MFYRNVIDAGEMLESHCHRRLDNMKAHSFAVSGTRKTATVVSRNIFGCIFYVKIIKPTKLF